jgi:hypothetical protein
VEGSRIDLRSFLESLSLGQDVSAFDGLPIRRRLSEAESGRADLARNLSVS